MDHRKFLPKTRTASATPRASRRPIQLTLLAAATVLASQALWAAPGDLDTSFGGGAFDITVSHVTSTGASALTFQDDGRVLLGGGTETRISAHEVEGDWALFRRNTDGSPDATFGNGTGQVIVPVGGKEVNTNSRSGSVSDLVVEPDGTIQGVGDGLSLTAGPGGYNYDNTHLVRWNADGTLDPGFGKGGQVTTAVNSTGSAVYAVALLRDGQPVVAGYARPASGASGTSTLQPFLARYAPSGFPDQNFGTNGIAYLSGVPEGYARSVTIQPDGKIVVGYISTLIQNPEVIRLTSNGAMDSSFGAGGVATVSGVAGQKSFQVVVQPDGKLVGISRDDVTGTVDNVFRLNADGSLDTTFNGQGWIPVDLGLFSMALLPTGQILVSGIDLNDATKIAVARITASGQLDATFTSSGGQSGLVETPSPSGGSVTVTSIKLLPDGRFALTGLDGNYLLVAQYKGDPVRLRPNDFAFTNVTGVPVSTAQVSNVVQIQSLTIGAQVPIQVFNGSYSINGAPFTSMLGYVKNGDLVMVEHTSAATSGTSVATTLRVGGLNAPNSPWITHGQEVARTFVSTTK